MEKLIFSFLVLLTSCGYHVIGFKQTSTVAVAVPYVQGDFKGFFTEELVRALGVASNLQFDTHADKQLIVKIVDENSHKIGYRYDRELDGKLKKNLLPIENRQKIKLKIEIVNKKDQKNYFGPFEFSDDIDFDYVKEDSLRDLSFIDPITGQRRTALAFSLGQLESISSAEDAAKIALYQQAAKRLVELLDSKLTFFFEVR